MSHSSRQTKKDHAKKDESPAEATQISMSALTSLLEDHCKSISSALSFELKESFASLESKLDAIQSVVSDHGERIASLEEHANSNEDRFQALETAYAELTETCAKLKAKNTDLEGRSRRNNIRVVGMPESEGPRPTAFFSKALAEIFGDEVLQTPPELDRAHRSLAAKPPHGGRPRPVIICFHRHQIKELVIREAHKRRNDLKFQDNPIRIYEDFSPEVQEQRAAYRNIMATLYNQGLRPALLYPARLQITNRDGSKKRFSSLEEATSVIRSLPAQDTSA